jgi:DNA-binding CsgD family transcriptional regulator
VSVYVTKPRTKPTEKEIELINYVSQGWLVIEAAELIGITYMGALSRSRRLKRISGQPTLAGLVYWGLTEMYIQRDRIGIKPLLPRELDVVKLLARGKTEAQAGNALHLSASGTHRRIKVAKLHTGASTHAHLVAIAWAEDWLV